MFQDALQRNEWKLDTRQRKYEPFTTDELIDIKFARDEMSAQMTELMVQEETKYYRRVQHSRKALDKVRFQKLEKMCNLNSAKRTSATLGTRAYTSR